MASSAATGTRVPVVDDEENIAYLVCAALRLEGFEARRDHRPGGAGRHRPAPAARGAVRCDAARPRRLRGLPAGPRRGAAAPVIFLTARDATEDRVRGLTIGGDDYVVKPFALEELVARVRVAAAQRHR
ncbi:MAG: response regulator [Acidimicrobiales bacterium]